ncbi:hypothetical protein [Spirulina sp. CCNP1310]|uniref:hypothetical protein n=1 Tax=Spirulina sp. CCNP1310 TaxID=3110249 RepID=UPI002B1F08B7|nr:hypothetical protein [Spirulina sp. CCNP1310]
MQDSLTIPTTQPMDRGTDWSAAIWDQKDHPQGTIHREDVAIAPPLMLTMEGDSRKRTHHP